MTVKMVEGKNIYLPSCVFTRWNRQLLVDGLGFVVGEAFLEGFIVEKDGYFKIFRNCDEHVEFSCESQNPIRVSKDGYIEIPTWRDLLLTPDGKRNLYDEPNHPDLPFMGGKIDLPPERIRWVESLHSQNGALIADLVDGISVSESYDNGITIRTPYGYSYFKSIQGSQRVAEPVIANAAFIRVDDWNHEIYWEKDGEKHTGKI